MMACNDESGRLATMQQTTNDRSSKRQAVAVVVMAKATAVAMMVTMVAATVAKITE